MAASSKEAMLAIIDVGTGAGKTTTKAVECCQQIIKHKLYHSKKDEIGFILLRSASSQNSLNDEMEGYQNILEYLPISIPDWQTVAKLSLVNDEPKSDTGDWLASIIVAMNSLRNEQDVKKFPYSKIVLFHDFDSKVDEDNLDTIVEGISSMGVKLVLVSNNVQYTTNESGITKSQFAATPDKSFAQQKSEELAIKIIEGCDGQLLNYDIAANETQSVETSRPWMWQSALEIGSKIRIQISAIIAIKNESKLKFTTESNVEGTQCWKATEYFKDGERIEPAADDLIRGYIVGGKPIAYDESLGVKKAITEKGLKCMFFSHQSYVLPEYLCGDGVYIVVAKKDAEASGKMMSALVQAMARKEMVLIARKVYNTGNKPKLVALLPNLEREVPCLSMFELYFAEQCVFWDFPLLKSKRTDPTKEQLNAIDKLIDTMDLSGDDVSDPRSTFNKEKLPLKNLPNLSVEYMLDSITKKVLTGSSHSRERDHLGNLFRVIHDNNPEIANVLQEVKNNFPLVEQVKAANKKDLIRHIGDIPSQAESQPTTGQPMETDYRTITEVGTVTPAEDYRFLIERDVQGDNVTDDEIEGNFNRLSAQMRTIINDLLFKSMTDQTEKITQALVEYREHACFHNPFDYNDWMKELKKKIVARKMFDFWENVIVKKELGLCWAQDCDYFDDLDDPEPLEFYKLPVRSRTAADQAAAEQEDVDDMFGNM